MRVHIGRVVALCAPLVVLGVLSGCTRSESGATAIVNITGPTPCGGCPDGGGNNNQAPTLTFTASPGTINSGSSSTLNWSSTNCTPPLTASGGWSGDKQASGSQSVNPTSSTTYLLRCEGSGGVIEKSVTVEVRQPTPTPTPTAPTCTLRAEPSIITAGQSALLIWDSTNATIVVRSWNQSSTSDLSGTNTVTPTTTTTYATTCTGPGGTRTATATVTVNAPQLAPTCQLTGPFSVPSGQNYTLNWNSLNATSWSATWGSVTTASGSVTLTAPVVSSTQTFTHTLICIGPGGQTPAPHQITVNPAQQNVCAGASASLPDAPPRGQTRGFQVNAPAGCQWKLDTTNPNWVSVNPPSGTGPASGSITALNSGTGTVTFSVRGANGSFEVRSQRNYVIP